jgi:hypothetical protein
VLAPDLANTSVRLSAPGSFTPFGTDPCQLIQGKTAAADTKNITLEYRVGCQNARYSVLADAPLSVGGLPRASQEQTRRERACRRESRAGPIISSNKKYYSSQIKRSN